MNSNNKIELLSSYFHALSDPIRLQVIEQLVVQEMCVSDLCKSLDLKQPKLSFHLKILKESGFVLTRQDGRWVYYDLNHKQFDLVKHYLTKYQNENQNQAVLT